MEIYEFKFVSHLFLFCYLICGFYNLGIQSILFAFVFFDQGFLLPVFFLKELLDSFGFDVACSTIFSSHQDLSLEIVSVFPNLGNSHIGFFQNGPQSLKDRIRFNPTFLDGLF